MGKMKELFIAQQEKLYHESFNDTHIPTDFIKVDNEPCPNCTLNTLRRNETKAYCTACIQDFYFADGELKFLS